MAKRDYKAEQAKTELRKQERLAKLAEASKDGRLGDSAIMLAQAMLLCALPYGPGEARQITRKARLGNGTEVRVTFTAAIAGVPLPYGADRKLIAWIFDRAIRTQSRFIPWSSAAEYRRDVGLKYSGRSLKQVAEQFHRVSGLVMVVERTGRARGSTRTVVDTFNLPGLLDVQTLEGSDVGTSVETDSQGTPFGIRLSQDLVADITEFHIAVPRALWVDSRLAPQVSDIAFWLYYRVFCARTESLVTWGQLAEMFDPDQHEWRIRDNATKAVETVKMMWPSANVAIEENGIRVDRSPDMLPEDPSKGRVRRETSRLLDSETPRLPEVDREMEEFLEMESCVLAGEGGEKLKRQYVNVRAKLVAEGKLPNA